MLFCIERDRRGSWPRVSCLREVKGGWYRSPKGEGEKKKGRQKVLFGNLFVGKRAEGCKMSF